MRDHDSEAAELRFYFDDNAQPVYRVTSADVPVSDQPMCVILNLAVGGLFGGDPNATTVFPQTFDVDYVRVYEKVDGYGKTKPRGDGKLPFAK